MMIDERKPDLTVLSLGGGVQSSVLALMLDREEHPGYPKPDFAVFADTQWEPQPVYEHLDWLETQLSYTVKRVTNGNIRSDILDSLESRGYVDIPLHSEGGMGKRQCTWNYKIKPIMQAIRSGLGLKPGQRVPKGVHVVQYIGISLDEAHRMKDAWYPYIQNTYPLVDWRMKRADCLSWFARMETGRARQRSTCLGCPFQSRAEWLARKRNPAEWADVVEFDAAMRSDIRKSFGYLHSSMKPLPDANLQEHQLELWENECEGMCGV